MTYRLSVALWRLRMKDKAMDPKFADHVLECMPGTERELQDKLAARLGRTRRQVGGALAVSLIKLVHDGKAQRSDDLVWTRTLTKG